MHLIQCTLFSIPVQIHNLNIGAHISCVISSKLLSGVCLLLVVGEEGVECRGCIDSKSLIIHEAKTKENHKRDGFGNVIKHLHKLAKLSPSFSSEVRICLRSCIKHSH